jgi:hypothetical protein
MRESNESALALRAPSPLEKAEPGARRILFSMVADTLALAKPIFTVLMCDADPTSNVAEVVIRSNWPNKYSIRFIRLKRDTEVLKLTQEQFFSIFFVYVGSVEWSTSAGDLFALFTQATEVWRQIEAQHGLLIIATQGMNLRQLFEGTGIMERLAVGANTFLFRQCNIEELQYDLKEVILQRWHRMGKQYFGGRGVPQDYAEAVGWFRKAAEQNYAQAQYALGICYDSGDGVTKDEFEAANWYRKAAEQNDAEGQFSLGVCYANGRGVEKDYAEAVKWYRRAAEQNHPLAQYNLGVCYGNGQGVTNDYTEAVKWYLKAAEQGVAGSQCRLGLHYDLGSGVSKNVREAAKWYHKAAEQGYAMAQRYLGTCYENGNGVSQNYTEATKWYRKAAEQGDAEAQCWLGMNYATGDGVAQDAVEAYLWVKLAEEQGYEGAAKAAAVIEALLSPEEFREAERRYRELRLQANHGKTPSQQVSRGAGAVTSPVITAAQLEDWFQAGEEYYFGEGVARDAEEAAKWYRKAAEQSHVKAQCALGDCYYNGEGVAKDYMEAVKWYREAAEQNHVPAQHNLGVCYGNGQGVRHDDAEAAKWYRKASEQNFAIAQHNLGFCYEKGHGVQQDFPEAYKLYKLAAEQNQENAVRNLQRIVTRMTTAEIAEGERRYGQSKETKTR